MQIGSHVLILAGREIGSNCAIGGHVVIDKNVPNNTLVYVQQTIIHKKYKPSKLQLPKPQIKIGSDIYEEKRSKDTC